jgi:hypothetical protein
LAGICGLSTVFGFALTVCPDFAFDVFIVFDNRDSVIAVKPFAQVYQFAAVAAEGVKLPIPAGLQGCFINNLITFRTSAFHIAIQSTIPEHLYKVRSPFFLSLTHPAGGRIICAEIPFWSDKNGQT